MSERIDIKKLFGMFGAQGSIHHLDDSMKRALIVKLGNALGLNQYTMPFRIYRDIRGAEFLYATKECCAQLRHLNGISILSLEERIDGDFAICKVSGMNKHGRVSYEIGSVNIAILDGQDKSNGQMWAVTKAKRRLTLDLSGLGVLADVEVKDMTEVAEYNVLEETPKQLEQGNSTSAMSALGKITIPKRETAKK
jgi:hypothetical protein